MAGVDLTPETRRRVEAVFSGDDARLAARLLVEECGNNLPFCHNLGPVELERIRFAALKLSGGTIDGLRRAVELAKTDWRDLLMGASFGHDINAHKSWVPERQKP